MNIEIISGSPRPQSVTHRLALYLQKLFTEKTQHNIGLIDVRQPAFPMVNIPFSTPEQAPEALQGIAARMFAAHAFVIVTPEYNGSYTPAVKNLFDNFPKQLHKAFGIVTASPGALGGIRASQQVQLMINGLMGVGSPVMLVTPFIDKKFDADGTLLDESFTGAIETFMAEFLWLAERVSA